MISSLSPLRSTPQCLGLVLGYLVLGLSLAAGAFDHSIYTRNISVDEGRQTLAQAQVAADPAAELRARIQLGNALRLASDYAAAEQVLTPGLALSVPAEHAVDRLWLDYNLGRLAWNRAKYADAEERFRRVETSARERDIPVLLARVLNSRGIVADNQGLTDQAERLFRQSLALAESAPDSDLRPKVLNNLALLLRDRGELPAARELLEDNLQLHLAADNRRGAANALVNLASIEILTGDLEPALALAERALELRLALEIPRHIAAARIQVAQILVDLQRAPEALEQLRSAATLAATVDSAELQANLAEALSRAHEANHQFGEALQFQREAEQARYLVYGEATATKIQSLRERYEADARQREIAELKIREAQQAADAALRQAELKRVNQERYGLIILLVLGAIAIVAGISYYRAKTRTERLILERTQKARDEAEHANALKTQLLDLLSHDLKNPLAAVQMSAEMIALESPSNPDLNRRAHMLQATAKRMLRLVSDLLDSSAAEEHRLRINRRPFNLAYLVEGQLRVFQERLDAKGQKLSFETIGSMVANIHADPDRIQQVLENLVDNAIKYSHPGATLTLQVVSEEQVRLRVLDQGPGFSAEDQERLFHRFARLSAQPTGGEASVGLGLFLVHQLTELNGGRLFLEQTSEQGSVFTAEFPAAE